MSYRLNIIVPVRVQKLIGQNIELYLIAAFGGWSRTQIDGEWINPENVSEKEDSLLYFALTGMNYDTLVSHMEDLETLIKLKTKEKEVLWWLEEIMR